MVKLPHGNVKVLQCNFNGNFFSSEGSLFVHLADSIVAIHCNLLLDHNPGMLRQQMTLG
ncbi:hypothetical protein PITC_019390 [Penicillium italicum]|uniref:Uncharacterized protein n=1 Tax=Penicillium italicum TaxID=40296 RepID=A0A0A2L5G6_PENIT|nr:hypothetical protein PITC_019390 [Penicillium italicum]